MTAFTVTNVEVGASARAWQVASSADADATTDITHGLGVSPLMVSVSPLAPDEAGLDANRLAIWSLDRAAQTATIIRVRKSTDAGSLGSLCFVIAHIPIQ